ncbi:hypothetical protein GWI34_17375 [Actinomadura sp. DSM 109109]|nr:hypothetical protein [Actinomadura lepetitiana]
MPATASVLGPASTQITPIRSTGTPAPASRPAARTARITPPAALRGHPPSAGIGLASVVSGVPGAPREGTRERFPAAVGTLVT